MRRAVIERGLLALPAAEAAQLIEAVAEQAHDGGAAARAVILALVSAVVHRRRRSDFSGLDRIEAAAVEASLTRAARLCGDVAASKALVARARLPEVGLNTEACFPSALKRYWRNDDGTIEVHVLDEGQLRRMAVFGQSLFGQSTRPLRDLVRHPSGAFLSRVLRTRWISQSDVLIAATRRPSTPEIAIAIAADDRWIRNPSVRKALLENPFTPGWLAAGLALAVPRVIS